MLMHIRRTPASTQGPSGSSSGAPGNRSVLTAALKRRPAGAGQQRPENREVRNEDGLLVYERQEQQQQRRDDDQESRNFRRALRFPAYELPALERDSSDYDSSKRAKKQAMLQQLEQQYGPHYSDSDVRLYLKKRQLNAQRSKPTRRGGLPLDDAIDRPETFFKLSLEFQRTILNERCAALTATLQGLHPDAAWQLYSSIPGLLTYMTLQVAQRLHGLSRATGLSLHQLVPQLVTFRRLAFLHPGTAESRVGLLARVARLDRQRAVTLMMQQPQLWLMDSRQLAPRAEQLALLLNCCTVTALKLIGSCPQLLTASLPGMQHQLALLCLLLGSSSSSRSYRAAPPASPAAAVPLLLWQPSLLLPAAPTPLQTGFLQQQQQEQEHDALQAQQQQELVPARATSMDALHGLQQQLQVLGDATQLPTDFLHQAVLQTPELLQLATPHSSNAATDGISSAAAAAVDTLRSSWLCSDIAVTTRQQYQQQLLQLLTARTLSQQKRKQQRDRQEARQASALSATPRFTATDVLSYMATSCQWWTTTTTITSSSSSHTFNPQQQQQQQAVQLSPLQQLIVQAPALLVISAAKAESVSGRPADGLELRAQSLCQQLLPVISQQYPDLKAHTQLQQQQQQPSSAATYNSLLEEVHAAAVLEPRLLAQPHAFVGEQLLKLSQLLAVSPAVCWGLLQACPGLLWLTEGQVFERIRVLCGVLRMSAAAVRQGLLTTEALPVLLLETDQVKDSFDALVAAAAAVSGDASQAGDVLQHVRSNLQLLLFGCDLRATCIKQQRQQMSRHGL